MSRLSSPFVLGYHGCDRAHGEALLSGAAAPKAGEEKYHWLGPGMYFWESDPLRGLDWARAKQSRGQCPDPVVIGAVIDLGNCLDFQSRENALLLKDAYVQFSKVQSLSAIPLPKNTKARNDRSAKKVLRFLDYAVIDYLLSAMEEAGQHFDTVRGVFEEGDPVYEGAGIMEYSHSQIAVRKMDRILGFFRPRGL